VPFIWKKNSTKNQLSGLLSGGLFSVHHFESATIKTKPKLADDLYQPFFHSSHTCKLAWNYILSSRLVYVGGCGVRVLTTRSNSVQVSL